MTNRPGRAAEPALARRRAEARGAALRVLLALGCGLAWGPGCASSEPVELSDGRYAMGTVLEVTLRGDEGRVRRALARCFEVVEVVEAAVSGYRPESGASELNARAGAPVTATGPLLMQILGEARRAAALTRGRFDVTVGPLVDLWREAAETGRWPEAARLARARALVGIGGLEIEPPDRAGLARPGMRVDLGGIAKGFALDRAVEAIAGPGLDAALLSFGQSSVRAIGRPVDAPAWRLLVETPTGPAVLELADRALSVSSSLEPLTRIEGRGVGRIVDPGTGLPATDRRLALVVAREATLAEALSTALLLLPRGELAEVVAAAGASAWVGDDDGWSWQSEAWQADSGFRRVGPASAAPPLSPSPRP